MILKSIIFSFALFLGYGLFTYFVIPERSVMQHQWQENIVKAEKFLYDETGVESVVVGTSLSCRMVMDSLPKVYNLSFGGQSVLDGLMVIKQKPELPRTVYIESNFIIKEISHSFQSSIKNPVLSPLKKMLYSVREDKQPIAVLGDIVRVKFMDPLLLNIKRDQSKAHSTSATNNKDAFYELLEDQVRSYQTTPDPESIALSFDQLSKELNYFKNNGVDIIFFEMPVNEQLVDLPFAQVLRKELQKRFPQNKYIPVPDCSQYPTTDGIHLTNEEAIRYTSYFKSNITSNSLMSSL